MNARVIPALLVACAVFALAGCGRGIDETYGLRTGYLGGQFGKKSVNGTAVLGEMFAARGHRVSSWDRFSPRLREKADVIVWFPDSVEPPPDDVRRWIESWLREKPDRTMIFVARDYDAGPVYWRRIKPTAPPEEVPQIDASLAASDLAAAARLAARPATQDCGWFTLAAQPAPRDIRTLEGDPAWLAGVDPAKLEIQVRPRLLPPDGGVETLLHSGPDTLVTRESFGEGSQLIVVAGGSFLLNMPLVNHEHRKLAGSLIREVGDDRKVVFIDCFGTPPVVDKEPDPTIQTGFELFGTPPFDVILLHLTVIGLVFCFCRFPIFGLPRRLEQPSNSDFGQHVAALGELLGKTGDRTYAQGRLHHYELLQRADDRPINPK